MYFIVFDHEYNAPATDEVIYDKVIVSHEVQVSVEIEMSTKLYIARQYRCLTMLSSSESHL